MEHIDDYRNSKYNKETSFIHMPHSKEIEQIIKEGHDLFAEKHLKKSY